MQDLCNPKNKTVIVALLDKEWPPHHSFVTGMLAEVVARQPQYRVQLIVSRNEAGAVSPRKYGRTTALPLLFPRRGLGRFINLVMACWAILYLVKKAERSGWRPVVFVRNDPVLLFAAALVRRKYQRLIFQSSFPHEETARPAIKRWIARGLYFCSRQAVDAITAVSPKGLERTSRLFPKAQAGPYIPLMADYICSNTTPLRRENRQNRPLRFIYVGTHSKGRQLEVIIEALALAVASGASIEARFIGGNDADRARLENLESSQALIEKGFLTFDPPVARPAIPAKLAEADVGISIPPPLATNQEMSPTKLAEYFGAGLAVIAGKGIALQEDIVRDSQGGILVDWGVDAIATGFSLLAGFKLEEVHEMGARALSFVNTSFSYSAALPSFEALIECDGR